MEVGDGCRVGVELGTTVIVAEGATAGSVFVDFAPGTSTCVLVGNIVAMTFSVAFWIDGLQAGKIASIARQTGNASLHFSFPRMRCLTAMSIPSDREDLYHDDRNIILTSLGIGGRNEPVTGFLGRAGFQDYFL